MKPSTLLLLAVLPVSVCFAKGKPAPLSADSIINRSVKAYSHLKSYSDSGKLTQVFLTEHPNKTAKVFKTAYLSNGDINFEYYEVGNANSLYTINRTNNIVKTWWGIVNRTDAPVNIQRALGAAAGVSGRTSMIVPQLLLTGDFKNASLYRTITNRAVAAEEQVNGKTCYKITGTERRGSVAIWIGKSDFLIRRMETTYVVDPAQTEAVNHKIDSMMKARGGAASNEHETAMKNLAMIRKMDSLRGKPARGAFTVKDSYSFFPTADGKIKPELLKFRPNREVAL